MIPSLVIAALAAVSATPPGSGPVGSSTVAADLAAPVEATEEPGLSRFRMPWEPLIDRTIGTASKPVKFDWRRSTVHASALIAQPVEFNNYTAFRLGGLVRIPTDTLMFELGLSYVWVWQTESSRQLALTPYRQPARPRRFEIDFTVGVPLAEGVVTTWPSFFPALELVFSAYFNFRYLIYPGGFDDFRFRDTFAALFNPRITDDEVANLDDKRLPGMEVDTQRYGFYAGIGTDIYFDFGLFVSPRVLFTVPLLAAATESKMNFGIDVSLAMGVAF